MIMKSIQKLAIPAAAAAIIALTNACGNNKTAAAKVGTLATENIAVTDSMEANNCASKFDFSVQYPSEGNAALLDSTRRWVVHTVAVILPMDSAEAHAYSSLTSEDLANGEKAIKAIAEERFASDKAEFDSFAPKDSISMRYSYQGTIDRILATDSVVTFTSSIYIYTGGAHGSTLVNAATFRASDGSQTGYGIFNQDDLPELTQMVKEAVSKQYFETGDDFKMDDALIIDPQDFPLPAVAPYFTENGLTFVYKQYEIACYAAGLPTCTIPYAEIAPLLTPAAKKLIP